MTLIEVMIALVVATVGLLGALAMNASMMQSSNFSRMATEATALVQMKMEEQQAAHIADTTCATSATETAINAIGTTAGSNKPYTRTTTWTAGSSGFAYCKLTVNVSWTDGAGITHQVQAQTQRAQP